MIVDVVVDIMLLSAVVTVVSKVLSSFGAVAPDADIFRVVVLVFNAVIYVFSFVIVDVIYSTVNFTVVYLVASIFAVVVFIVVFSTWGFYCSRLFNLSCPYYGLQRRLFSSGFYIHQRSCFH